MQSDRNEKTVLKRPRMQTIARCLLVDIIPTLLLLSAMALGMALLASRLTTKPLLSDSQPAVEKVS
jgi:hypothetical protein